MIAEWAQELADTDPEIGMPLCPFAKPAWEQGRVRVIESEDLWSAVLKSIWLVNDDCDVVTVISASYDKDYDALEETTDRLNDFFFSFRLDLWALSYLGDEAVIFLQRLTDLDNSAAKLEKLGYYNHYTPNDYQRLVVERRKRRHHYARNKENDARK